MARAKGRRFEVSGELEQSMRLRARAALTLIDRGELDPVLGLSYVVWPPGTEGLDDPDAGRAAIERRHGMAA